MVSIIRHGVRLDIRLMKEWPEGTIDADLSDWEMISEDDWHDEFPDDDFTEENVLGLLLCDGDRWDRLVDEALKEVEEQR